MIKKAAKPTAKSNVQPLLQKAVAAHQAGDLTLAQQCYKAVLKANPNQPEALHLHGLICKAEGDRSRFYELTERSLKIAPNYAAAWANLANAHREDNRLEEAGKAAKRALELNDKLVEAWNTLALVEHKRGELDAAIEHLERALELAPDNLEFQSNYGAALHAADREKEAETWYRQVLGQDRTRPRPCNNYGVMLKDRGETEAAIRLYRHAIAREPSYSDAHWNLALALLSTRQFEEGWAEYEWRWTRSDSNERRPDHPFKELAPGHDWKGKKLFIYAEQGLGDTLQFMRYIRPLCDHAHVSFAPQALLLPLLATLNWPNFQLVKLEAVPAKIDYALPVMSLPYLFPEFARQPSFPGPYLSAREDRVQITAPIFERERFNVGLVWQGSKNKIDKGRSIPLKTLVPLTQVAGTRFYSLQRKDGVEQLTPPPEGIQLRVFSDPYDADGAFLDTAAVIQNLDLVITTDTAMAHLVGALGKEAWILLQHVPDWRWGQAGDTNPWYPHARLYRQTSPGDWAGVVQRVQHDLARRAAAKLGHQPG